MLEGDLEGEADTAIVTVLLDLAQLVELATTQYFRIKLEGAQTSGYYLKMARRKAEQMGDMFVNNCRTREKEIEGIRIAFG